MMPINWSDKVAQDFRKRILVDANSPILAFKASRDRYANLPNQSQYAGLPHLGSWQSEDALTWNVFRSLQEAGSVDIITRDLKIGKAQGLLLWTLAPEINSVSSKLQYVTGALIRKFDGIFRGQLTEPDVIVLGTTGIAVIECKLSEPDKAPAHLWEGEIDSVAKRLPIYQNEIHHFIEENISSDDIAPVYQLVRMAFYAMKLGASFGVEPVVVSLVNERNWSVRIHRLGKSATELWQTFRKDILGSHSPRCVNLTWQGLRKLIESRSFDTLSAYLSTHPCL